MRGPRANHGPGTPPRRLYVKTTRGTLRLLQPSKREVNRDPNDAASRAGDLRNAHRCRAGPARARRTGDAAGACPFLDVLFDGRAERVRPRRRAAPLVLVLRRD